MLSQTRLRSKSSGLSRSSMRSGFAIASLFSLLLYVLFLSVQYDLNGIIEAIGVEAGGINLFPPNHLLFRPIGWSVYEALRWLGYDGRSLVVLQGVTALCGALGIGFAFLAFYHLTGHRGVALAASLWLATSWAYWSFSTDVYYITPAAMLVAGALAWFTHPRQSHLSVAGAGCLCGLAILMWQANVFLIPAFVFGLLWTQRRQTLRDRLIRIGILGASSGFVVGAVYLGVGTLIYGHRSGADFTVWLANYGGGRLPIWGHWSADRIPLAAISIVASIIPVSDGLGLRNLLRGALDPSKLNSLVSIVALFVLTAWTLRGLFQACRKRSDRLDAVVWLGCAYAIFLPFIVWWDPYEPKWFVVPNVFLGAVLASLWSVESNYRRTLQIITGCLCIIASANFSATIWPHHTRDNPYVWRAECVAGHMTSADMLIATDWNWPDYVRYFHSRGVLSLIDMSTRVEDTDKLLAVARQRIFEARQQGGSAYMIDMTAYSPDHIAWLYTQTGLTSSDFERFESVPAFACESISFRRITELR